jgi:hypothetical protein
MKEMEFKPLDLVPGVQMWGACDGYRTYVIARDPKSGTYSCTHQDEGGSTSSPLMFPSLGAAMTSLRALSSKLVEEKLVAICNERDEAMRSLDLDLVKAFHQKYNPGMALPADDILEASMHKARTAIGTFTDEEKELSRAWLAERGYSPLGEEGADQ